ncbi:RipA family octameric membrane protein [Dasania marina]|uniref:RipA family octameric membrane protein n=1 Tax=Dasania marina TaxID=471499 RepID=UPI00036C2580|nr:hypothetical protein [Dasania marina]
MYLEEIAKKISNFLPRGVLPEEHNGELLQIYAVLLRVKGQAVTESDVHDAWSAWMAREDPSHESLKPFDLLDSEIQNQDKVFVKAIRKAAIALEKETPSRSTFDNILFPEGPPKNEDSKKQALELYKIMVQSSEGLVGRRQAVNTFFLTMNGALLTASGLIVKSSEGESLAAWGIFVLAIAGVVLCSAWRSLIISFGQLNAGKFKVINSMERHLEAAIYAAEWEALGRGENPKIYRSFTSREIWVPNALLILHGLTVVVSILIAIGCISIG